MAREILKTLGALVFALMAVGLLWLIFQIPGDSEREAPDQPNTVADLMPVARHMCQAAIEGVLNDPSRAEMGNHWSWPAGVDRANDRQILVQPEIRAPNVFGGIVRTRFQCTFEIIGDFETVSLIGLREV